MACWPVTSAIGAGSVLELKFPYDPGWQAEGVVVEEQLESSIRTWLNEPLRVASISPVIASWPLPVVVTARLPNQNGTAPFGSSASKRKHEEAVLAGSPQTFCPAPDASDSVI